MFMDEMSPIFRELLQQPIAFLGGFASGALHLNLEEDPVRKWLDRQSGTQSTPYTSSQTSARPNGPQSISIE